MVICGIGAERATKAAECLFKMKVSGLISWGIAGGLANSLHSGDLVLPDVVVTTSGDNYHTDTEWNKRIKNCLTDTSVIIHNGRLASSDSILGSSQEKSKYNLSTNACAVDMESAAIAKFADEENLSFIAIRSIIDESSTAIPKYIRKSTNEYGVPSISRLLLSILNSSGNILDLYQLSRSMDKAIKTLMIVAGRLKN